jgi:hypothetical protein
MPELPDRYRLCGSRGMESLSMPMVVVPGR